MDTFVPKAKTIGLVIPTRWESKMLFKRHGFTREAQGVWRATVTPYTCLALISGVGKKAAASAAQRLCDQGAQILYSVGFCGALVPELRVGDLVTDRMATVDFPVCSYDERHVLAQKANAVAVDMETQAVIETGTRLGVPIRVLRVVSDEVHENLAPLFGPSGAWSATGIAWRLLNPMIWPLAYRLWRNSRLASLRLAEEFPGPLATLS